MTPCCLCGKVALRVTIARGKRAGFCGDHTAEAFAAQAALMAQRDRLRTPYERAMRRVNRRSKAIRAYKKTARALYGARKAA